MIVLCVRCIAIRTTCGLISKPREPCSFLRRLTDAVGSTAVGAGSGQRTWTDEMKVPDDKLRSVLGITDVKAVVKKNSLAVVDSTLAPAGAAGGE